MSSNELTNLLFCLTIATSVIVFIGGIFFVLELTYKYSTKNEPQYTNPVPFDDFEDTCNCTCYHRSSPGPPITMD